MNRPNSWLAFDIGGANLKAAHSSGMTASHPFELWKHPERLPAALQRLLNAMPRADGIALTMTAELCDCFATKAEGVQDVLTASESAFQGLPIRVWTTEGNFQDAASVRLRPEIAAASNWLALAIVAARMMPEGPGLLIDVGSTTTDLIPTLDGVPVPRGRTDTERLRTGELVYAGVRRTPLCALADRVTFRGEPTGLMAELFATTLDVYLVLEMDSASADDTTTADGRPATRKQSRERLARMVGADREGFSMQDAIAMATEFDARLLDRLEEAARRACRATIGPPRSIVVAGSGEFLARRLAGRLLGTGAGPILSMEERWGPSASAAACARALCQLAMEEASG